MRVKKQLGDMPTVIRIFELLTGMMPKLNFFLYEKRN
jgi:hypothetical protein